MGINKLLFRITLSSVILLILLFSTKLAIPISTLYPITTSYNTILKLPPPPPSSNSSASNTTNSYPVSFAYLISASTGDAEKVKRVLLALYHPANYYLVHLDSAAPESEHQDVADFISNQSVFRKMANVWIVGQPNLVTYRGPTMLSTTLRAMSILLRSCDWDWFINLSASDYPLLTQDDLIHAFSSLPRDLNFVHHSSRLGWKFNGRAKPIMIDPGLYSSNKSNIWWVNQQRALPTAFKLYAGSAWTVLSRSFAEYTIVAWDNFPRNLLLYYTNFVSSPEGYFQTLICNSDYRNTTINHDLHFLSWDNPPKQHPRILSIRDYKKMVMSFRPFARKFKKNDRVLDKIDQEILKRSSGGFSYGGWCEADDGSSSGGCDEIQAEKYGVLKPGRGYKRLGYLLNKQLQVMRKTQCK